MPGYLILIGLYSDMFNNFFYLLFAYLVTHKGYLHRVQEKWHKDGMLVVTISDSANALKDISRCVFLYCVCARPSNYL